jgi:GNAT superfamily N-acetyltransferase
MTPPLEELAEDTIAWLLPQPGYETVDRGDLFLAVAPHNATVQRIRLGDVEEAVAWARENAGRSTIEWWLGWSSTPADAAERLLAAGLVRDSVPTLTGMTCATPPPAVPEIDVRPLETADDYLAAVQVDWEVWDLSTEERAGRLENEVQRFDEIQASGVVHHFAAYDGERPIGFGRAVDMAGGVALMGGAVLPDARGRGAYRALVRARWDHAAERETPLLVVQAGDLSAPVLEGLGFERHGEIRLYVDQG